MEFNRLHNFVNNYFEIIHQYLPNITKSEMQTIILYNRENYGTAIEFINNIKDYSRAIIDYMAGMTDQYIVRVYNEIVSF